jgi:hypothetical protein
VSNIDYTALLRIAILANAYDRPWEWQGGYPQRVVRVGDMVVVADTFESPDRPPRFAEHIAAFDPPTALALLSAPERLRAALNGFVWLDNNRHNYGTDAWLGWFDAAVTDARAALDNPEEKT